LNESRGGEFNLLPKKNSAVQRRKSLHQDANTSRFSGSDPSNPTPLCALRYARIMSSSCALQLIKRDVHRDFFHTGGMARARKEINECNSDE
jgi:hypothetical protein